MTDQDVVRERAIGAAVNGFLSAAGRGRSTFRGQIEAAIAAYESAHPADTQTHYLRPDAEDAGHESATACGALPLSEPSSALERVDCVDCLRRLAAPADTQMEGVGEEVRESRTVLADTERPQTQMQAILDAGHRVRGGFMHWLKGAPTHVLAELLRELEKDGWQLTNLAQHPDPVWEALAELVGVQRLVGRLTCSDEGGPAAYESALRKAKAALADSPLGRVEREAASDLHEALNALVGLDVAAKMALQDESTRAACAVAERVLRKHGRLS